MHFKLRIFVALVPVLLSVQQVFCVALDGGIKHAEISKHAVQKSPLNTDWTDKVDTSNPWPEYPRPQLERSEWKSLNGLWMWQEAVNGDKSVPRPTEFQREVMVPSCLESGLSGIGAENATHSWYYRSLDVPQSWSGQRVLLNFGAVDYEATIYINGTHVGSHRGGYTGFTLDITEAVSFGGIHDLHVNVIDTTDSAGNFPIGKQAQNPSHIFYTACTGIWQGVWIEAAPSDHITQLDMHGSTSGEVTITAHTNDNIAKPQAVIVSLFEYGKAVAMAFGYSNRQFTFPVSDPKIWSPSSPALYNVTVAYGNDTIKSYMGFRTIEVGVVKGVKRPLLNGEVVFQMGLLDQGYWPDGIYTPPTKEAMIFDLEKTKEAGFNMLRKHVKVEPALFYRACDELGILVIQDMPSMRPANDGEPSSYEYVEFARQLEEMVQQLRSYPSIVTWTIYNEAWGQGSGAPERGLVDLVREIDPTRLIDAASGWRDHGEGDFSSNHYYPGPKCGIMRVKGPSAGYDPNRIAFQSEFGGLGTILGVENLWNTETALASMKDTYRLFDSFEDWNKESHNLLMTLKRQVEKNGCSAAVWTQTTDVEGEVNGLMSYDRRIMRADFPQWRKDIQSLYDAAQKHR